MSNKVFIAEVPSFFEQTSYNVFLPVLQFSPVSIIPPLLHTHLFIYHSQYIILAFETFLNNTFNLGLFLFLTLHSVQEVFKQTPPSTHIVTVVFKTF